MTITADTPEILSGDFWEIYTREEKEILHTRIKPQVLKMDLLMES